MLPPGFAERKNDFARPQILGGKKIPKQLLPPQSNQVSGMSRVLPLPKAKRGFGKGGSGALDVDTFLVGGRWFLAGSDPRVLTGTCCPSFFGGSVQSPDGWLLFFLQDKKNPHPRRGALGFQCRTTMPLRREDLAICSSSDDEHESS